MFLSVIFSSFIIKTSYENEFNVIMDERMSLTEPLSAYREITMKYNIVQPFSQLTPTELGFLDTWTVMLNDAVRNNCSKIKIQQKIQNYIHPCLINLEAQLLAFYF